MSEENTRSEAAASSNPRSRFVDENGQLNMSELESLLSQAGADTFSGINGDIGRDQLQQILGNLNIQEPDLSALLDRSEEIKDRFHAKRQEVLPDFVKASGGQSQEPARTDDERATIPIDEGRRNQPDVVVRPGEEPQHGGSPISRSA